jgi:excisionase family DNA binding protein
MNAQEKENIGIERRVESEISGGRERVGEISWGGSSFFENRIQSEWLSTKEAAHLLSLSENALRIMVHRGQIKVHHFRRRLRFRKSDCLALFERKRV